MCAVAILPAMKPDDHSGTNSTLRPGTTQRPLGADPEGAAGRSRSMPPVQCIANQGTTGSGTRPARPSLTQPRRCDSVAIEGLLYGGGRDMGFPDQIQRVVELDHPPAKVWAALTTAEGLGTWFGNKAAIDLRPGGAAQMTWTDGPTAEMRDRTRRRAVGLRLHLAHLRTARGRPTPHLRRVHARARRRGHAADRRRVRLRPAARGPVPRGLRRQHEGLGERAGRSRRLPRCRLTTRRLTSEHLMARRSPNRSSLRWPTRAGAPSSPRSPRRARPPRRDLAARLPITRQAIAKHLTLLADAGLVTAEPGERRRVRYRLRSAPMQVAQQFLAALARDWDGPLDALTRHLNR